MSCSSSTSDGTSGSSMVDLAHIQNKVAQADNEDGSDYETEMTEEMNPRERLAVTLMNWSSIPDNDHHMLQEGAVTALISLANIDDDRVKKCVSWAFYHLSSREPNRLSLLRLGAVNGLVTIAMKPTKFNVAKLCALTLCNLSMSQNEESALAENGTILALVILLGMRGHRLLPVCVQALYNLTSCGWTQHFKPDTMRRVVKALMNVPQTFFDHQLYLIKSILNISRFSWVRSRMVEDGALISLVAFTESIPNRQEKENNCYLAVSCLRMFSENVSGKTEMITKGCLRPLKNILKYCNCDTLLQLLLIVFNLIQLPMSTQNLELAAYIVTFALNESTVVPDNDLEIYQYVAACLYLFCQQHQKFSFSATKKILMSLVRLLGNENPFIQGCVIPSCEALFFNKHLKTMGEDVREFISKFTLSAPSVVDVQAKGSLGSTIAKLAQEPFHMSILSEDGLLNPLLLLLLDLDKKLKNSIAVKECVCVAVCHIAINMNTLPGFIDMTMADIMTELLNEDDPDLVRNAICSIRSLSQINICKEELMSEEVISRIACIIETYSEDSILIRNSVAVLTVFSFEKDIHEALAEKDVLKVLFKITKTNDISSRELIATTICNLSSTAKSRKSLINNGVVGVLDYLSGTTSELIQELCAKTICNLTFGAQFHGQLIKQGVLQIIMVISLVRSISMVTKKLCARSLLNLLTGENLKDLNESGAIRIFSSLSTIPSPATQNICARGFLIFTGTDDKRANLLSRPVALQALFSMVSSQSEEARMMAGISICNLLCTDTSQKVAISSGGISVLKVLSVIDKDDMKESIARVSVNLISQLDLLQVLLEDSLVPVLILFLHQDSPRVFDIALHAISCMSQMAEYRAHMIDEGVVIALVSAVISGKWDSPMFAMRVCQILCLLSFAYEKADSMVFESHIAVAFHTLYRTKLCTPKAACLMAICLRNLSFDSKTRKQLIKENCLKLMSAMLTDVFIHAKGQFMFVRQCVLPFLHNICLEPSLHQELLNQGLMSLLLILARTGSKNFDTTDQYSDTDSDDDAYDSDELKYTQKKKISLKPAPPPDAIVMLGEIKKRKSFSSSSNSLQSSFMGSVRKSSLCSVEDNTPAVSSKSAPLTIAEVFHKQEDDMYTLPPVDPNKIADLMSNDIHHIAKVICLLAHTESCHAKLIDSKAVKILHALAEHTNIIDLSRHEIAVAICRLSATTDPAEKKNLSDEGAAEILMAIANVVKRRDTQMQCSTALGYLSDITKVNRGVVTSLLLLSMQQEEEEKLATENPQDVTGADQNFILQFPTPDVSMDLNNKMRLSALSPGGPTRATRVARSTSRATDKYDLLGLKLMLKTAKQKSRPTNRLIINGMVVHAHASGPEIEELILPKNGFKVTKEELDMCYVDYSPYLFDVVICECKPELAGPATKVSFPNLSLPKATARSVIDMSTRYSQLPAVVQITEPLPKDLTPVSIDMDLKDQRDDVNAIEATDTMDEMPLMDAKLLKKNSVKSDLAIKGKPLKSALASRPPVTNRQSVNKKLIIQKNNSRSSDRKLTEKHRTGSVMSNVSVSVSDSDTGNGSESSVNHQDRMARTNSNGENSDLNSVPKSFASLQKQMSQRKSTSTVDNNDPLIDQLRKSPVSVAKHTPSEVPITLTSSKPEVENTTSPSVAATSVSTNVAVSATTHDVEF